ncbi:uncharacterized protein LOC129772999 [Toxorhynchites rutilus septentrionalis]|uniref:uncharacterized protein LOC129772999 n=1 Tax=Toxorhynchites rutilus septentrionalis TaxID=329112 RepID=UPI00247A5BC4|nr:uncharacterized protein LOC129772999 [Toxorhynchites rutilus septentrionalis]
MKLIEEEQKMKEQALQDQEAMDKKAAKEALRNLEERKALVEEEAKIRQQLLRDEKALQEKQQKIRRESLEKKQNIIRQISECGSRGGSIHDSQQKVSNWLDKCSEAQDVDPVFGEAGPSSRPNPPLPNTDRADGGESQRSAIVQHRVEHRPARSEGVNEPQQTPRDQQTADERIQHNLSCLPDRSGIDHSVPRVIPRLPPGLTRQDRAAPTVNLEQSHMAARQVMGKELPHFSGNPEDWPIFICSLEQTTAACGYTDAENLIRLQRCLKGHALESVRSRLLLPSSVPQVISTLRTLYGRPELLIRSLIEKVHRAPAPRHDRLETVVEFGLTVQNLVDHLKAANQVLHLANPVLVQELVEKLPGSLKLEWAVYKSRQPDATLATFGEFMGGLVSAASQVTFDLPSSSRNFKGDHKTKERGIVQTHSPFPAPTPASNLLVNKKLGKPCIVCNREGHRVVECDKFKSFSLDERWNVVHQKALCRTCLNSHGKWPCKSWKGCGIEGCHQKHNKLLHLPSQPQPYSNMSANHLIQGNGPFPMFRVLPVVLYAGERFEVIFAFIDEGSSISLLDETIAERLCATGPSEPLTLQWTGMVTREEPGSKRVQLDISVRGNSNRHKLSYVRTVSCLVLPSQTLKYKELCQRYPHLRGLPLEDYEMVQPKLLIGLDHLRLGVPLKLREGGPMDPIAAKCRLGWSVYGCLSDSPSRAVVNFHVAAYTDPDQKLNNQLRDYFALEDVGVSGLYGPLESDEDTRARKILERTTRRTEHGFETGLLWRDDNPDFPDSYPMAVRRLYSLEKKLEKNPTLKEQVREQISEYVRKGYARQATESELGNANMRPMWFIPLGVVVHPKKPNKGRLIWDAAAVANGVSLNSKLLKGPDLLTPLPAVLSRFRQFPVAVCGDIREMFHQLWIRSQDRLAQCFLWRENRSDPIQVFMMNVATFGATCSPASAQYVKNLNAQEFAGLYPRASAAIVKNHYVDDYLDSFMTVEEAVEVVKEVILVHEKGGFEIRKFRSNSTQLLWEIGEITADEPKDLILEREGISESVLGMKWLPKEDRFVYTVNLREDLRAIVDETHIPSKREVLKVVMSLFDPLGLISHLLVHGKVIIQGTWALGIGWDEPINCDLYQKWRQWVNLFPKLDKLSIPRCFFSLFPDTFEYLQIHTFVDASDTAYSCAIYFRLVHKNNVQLALVGAKSKVAPLKTLSIPRLELKAAVLGVRLQASILEYHTFPVSRRFLWSDSTTVLAWIRSDHRRFHKFVSVRIGEILTLSDRQEWRWVQSKHNVADVATKWKNGPNLEADSPWLRGPKFLYYGEQSWPKHPPTVTSHEEIQRVQAHWNSTPLLDYSRFNRWTKLLRTMAYVFRFIESVQKKNFGQHLKAGLLTQRELARAELVLWKMAQEDAFPEERTVLKTTQGNPEIRHATVSKSSSIYKTWPFMDEQGILRMRGRIGAAPYVPFEAKWPAILPKCHPITTLITDFYHRQFRHANRETVVNEMRQRFEVAKLRSLIQRVTKNCVFCKITKTIPRAPVMAPLPEERLQPFVRPFTYVGVDYFGPVLVKAGRSQVKCWVALFTCMTIRAVHMEVVHSLSTESCVMAVRRFVCRRGSPAVFYSDNGTCFQGASRQLQEEISAMNETMATTFTNARTAWKFIPPATPHMGGVWERLVRSVKTAIFSALNIPRKPDDETLKTIIYEAEALVNSRPLTYIPLESADQESLTPNHFLLGNSTGLHAETEVIGYVGLRSSWKQAQHITGELLIIGP